MNRDVETVAPRRRWLLVAREFALLFGGWLVLSGARLDGLAFGAAAAAAATWTSLRSSPPGGVHLRWPELVALVPGFLRSSLAGGLDVAWRAFHPRCPLTPGWIAYPLRLPRGAARVMLGSEISLLPGTLVAGVERGHLLVHCLDTTLPVERQVREQEDRLRGAIADD